MTWGNYDTLLNEKKFLKERIYYVYNLIKKEYACIVNVNKYVHIDYIWVAGTQVLLLLFFQSLFVLFCIFLVFYIEHIFVIRKKIIKTQFSFFFPPLSSCLHTECFKSSSEAQRCLSTLTWCLNLLLVLFSFLFDYANVGMSQNLPITWALSSVGI